MKRSAVGSSETWEPSEGGGSLDDRYGPRPLDPGCVVALSDVRACIRLVRGVSLPADMQSWRAGLLERLQAAVPQDGE